MNYILNIRKLVKEKKIKGHVLAAHLNVSPTTINNWLNENNPMPVPAFIALCDFVKVPYDYFFKDNPSENDKIIHQNIGENEKLLKENSKLKDKIIELQDQLYMAKWTLNEKTG